jgi:hypothetical protein|tara:strand:+ start:504 stop:1571 length:1068 start_codon:yes stop_codon:yes gene_type:complete
MASSYSTDLKLELMVTGENSGTWGDKTNTNLNLVQQAIAGYEAINVASADVTLAMTNATLSNARNMVLSLTGTLAGTRVVNVPDGIEKTYIVADNTTRSGNTLTIKTVSGTGVAIPEGKTVLVYADGTNVQDVFFMKDLVEDTTPQLGGNLDTNSHNIIIDDDHHITDENNNEQLTFQTTASAVNNAQLTNAATGNAPEIAAIGGDTNVDLNVNPKGLGRVVLGAGAIQQTTEKATVSATAASGTVNFDAITQAVLYYTSNASGNWTLNIRGDGSNSLNNIMDTGESLTVVHLVTMTTAYYNSAVQVDGSGVTPEWQGGSAPDGGNSNSVDIYTYTVIKTGDATFKVFAAQTQFA